MRFAFVTPGNSIHERRIAAKAIERGHEVCLISTRHARPSFDVPGVRFCHYHPGIRRFKTIPMVFHLKRMLRELAPDLVLSSLPGCDGFLVALTGFHPHATLPWGTDILHLPFTSWLVRQRTLLTLRKADAVLCISTAIQDSAHELSPRSVTKTQFITFFAVDHRLFSPEDSPLRRELGWSNNRVLIMTRSSYPAVYGVEYFVEALPAIVDAEPQIRIIFVGSGSLDCELRRRVEELGMEDRVRWAGRVDQETLAAYLNAADIYVSASFTDGSSVSLLEAMACALPVVVSDIPANRDWVAHGRNGLLVDVGDYAAIQSAINQHLRKHPDLWNETDASSSDFPMPVSPTYSQDIATAVIALLRDAELRAEMGRRNLHIVRERADLDTQFTEFERLAERLIAERRGQVNGAFGHSDD